MNDSAFQPFQTVFYEFVDSEGMMEFVGPVGKSEVIPKIGCIRMPEPSPTALPASIATKIAMPFTISQRNRCGIEHNINSDNYK